MSFCLQYFTEEGKPFSVAKHLPGILLEVSFDRFRNCKQNRVFIHASSHCQAALGCIEAGCIEAAACPGAFLAWEKRTSEARMQARSQARVRSRIFVGSAFAHAGGDGGEARFSRVSR